MLKIRHLRENRVPFGTVVMDLNGNVGVSICSPKDHFNKKRGVQIATGRYQKCDFIPENLPNRLIIDYNYDLIPLRDFVEQTIERMRNKVPA